MLIIEIALGIVLGWLIINHFDAVVETLLFIFSSIIRAIFFPFKLLKNIVVNTFQFVTQYYIKIFQLLPCSMDLKNTRAKYSISRLYQIRYL